MGLPGTKELAIGNKDQIFALAPPIKGKDLTMYHYEKQSWLPIEEPGAQVIAVA